MIQKPKMIKRHPVKTCSLPPVGNHTVQFLAKPARVAFRKFKHFKNLNKFFLSLFIYFERERERAQVGEEQREGERIPSSLRKVGTETDTGLKPMNRDIVT